MPKKLPPTSTDKKQNTPKDGKEIKSDLDSLFKSKKSISKQKPANQPKPATSKVEEKKQKKEKLAGKMFEKAKEIDKTANAKKVRKTTEDGFKIYTMEELGIGKGGDTELCPFDCDCCF